MGEFVKPEIPLSPREEGDEGLRPLLSKNVVVLARNFSLTKEQEDLLNKGLTFIPTIDIHKEQKKQLKLDLQNYHRKIKLAAYFGNVTTKELKPFMGNSTWIPPPDKIPVQIHELIKKDEEEFNKYFRCYEEKNNLSREQVKALRELMRNKNIIIKPADKGSVVVIMGRDQYIMEAERQLNNEIYYKKLSEPIYLKTVPEVHKILEKLWEDKFINGRQKQYLKGQAEPRPRRFYILPKIHKDPQKWTVPYQIPPGRPIVSDCGSETYQTAEFIDYYLNPLSTRHPSYIKDTYHFIEVVKNLIVPTDSMFFSIDVESLYTNIDTPSGIAAVKKILKKYPDITRPDRAILKLLEINLTKNDFEFNGKFYLQIKGTAMGKKFSPAYANIFMANWEEEIFAKTVNKPLHYLRYLDDIWGIWTGSQESFHEWFNELNTHDPSIKLQYTLNSKEINFLDTTVYKGQAFEVTQKLDIKVFFKETDTHALLFKNSFHPKHTYRGLIKSQLIRFKRICTQEQDFRDAVKILFKSLRQRGYSRSFLRNCLDKLDITKEINTKQIIPLITTYSKMSTIINNKVKNNYKTLIDDHQIIQNHRIISAYRRNKNLKDLLVNARIKPVQQAQIKSNLRDKFCNLKYVKNRRDKTIFLISQKFNLTSQNCVYLLFCAKCGVQYIGETKNSIRLRISQHKYNIVNKRETSTPLVKHFLVHGWQNVRIGGIQRNILWTDKERKKWERIWIIRLGTKEPFGLNIKL